jgi:hypothetical protein
MDAEVVATGGVPVGAHKRGVEREEGVGGVDRPDQGEGVDAEADDADPWLPGQGRNAGLPPVDGHAAEVVPAADAEVVLVEVEVTDPGVGISEVVDRVVSEALHRVSEVGPRVRGDVDDGELAGVDGVEPLHWPIQKVDMAAEGGLGKGEDGDHGCS